MAKDSPPSPEQNAKFLAEARRAEAEARVFEADAAQAEIRLAKAKYERAKELAGDEHHHLYRFTSQVDQGTARVCMQQLAVWNRNHKGCDIEIVFTSPGGSIIDGMALYDFLQDLRQDGHKVTTRALGVAASMAGILLQAGDVRVMAPESWLLIHQASFGAIGSFGAVEDTVEWVKQIQKRIVKIFAARSNLSEKQIERRWHRTDWWISSDDALKFGLVDEVR